MAAALISSGPLFRTLPTFGLASALDTSKRSLKPRDSGRVHQILGEGDFTQDDFSAAIAQFREAIRVDPNLPGIHYQLGHALLTNAQDLAARQQAQHEFEQELKHDPSDFRSEYELGEVARLSADPNLTTIHYTRALQLRPDFADAQLGLGQILETQGKPQEAVAHLAETARLDPDNETAHYRLSRIYRALGRTSEAESEMVIFRKLHAANDTHEPTSRAGATSPNAKP